MAKLGILPLNQYVVGASTLPWSDGLTSTSWDSITRTIRTTVGYSNGALIEVRVDAGGNADQVTAALDQGMDSLVAARVNRLLHGMGFPRVEKYQRTGAFVARLDGQPSPVPCVIRTDRDVYGNWTAKNVGATPAAPLAPQAPAPAPAPVQTPTPPPAPAPEPAATVEAAPAPEPAVQALRVAVEAKPEDPSGLFYFPARATTDSIITTPLNSKVLRAAWTQHAGGERAAVALVGPAGTGKTSIVDDLAAEYGVGVFNFDAAGASSFVDWTGTTALTTDEDGNTVTRFVPSSFTEAIRADGPYGDTPRIVRVDEVNRAETGGALNALMPILSQASLYIPETGQTVPVSHAVFFAFTLNRGSAYAGTVTLDAALADRMQAWIMLDYLSQEDEADLLVRRTGVAPEVALQLVKTAHQVREIASRGEITTGVSTRRVLQAGRLVQQGLSARESAEYCWANAYADEGGAEGERGLVMLAINSALVDAKPEADVAF